MRFESTSSITPSLGRAEMLALQPATAVHDQLTMRLLGLPCRLVDTGKLTCHSSMFDPDGTMTDRSLQPVRMPVRDFGARRSGFRFQPPLSSCLKPSQAVTALRSCPTH